MNPAHVHLWLNHLPVVGTFFGLLLLLVAILRRSAELPACPELCRGAPYCGGKFIRRTRSWKRGSEWRGWKMGSALTSMSPLARSS